MTIQTPSLGPTLHDWRASKLYIYNIYLFIYFTNDCLELQSFLRNSWFCISSQATTNKSIFSSHIKKHIIFFRGDGPGLATVEGPEWTSTHHHTMEDGWIDGWMDGWMIHGHETVSYWVPVSLTNHGWLISCFFWLSTY